MDLPKARIELGSPALQADTLPAELPGKLPWRRKWHPTPVLLPGESHRRRSLVGYSSRGRKESDTTERLHFHFHPLQYSWASLVAQMVNICLQCGRPGFDPWIGKIPWRRKWHPTPVLSPGKFHGWRSLVGSSLRLQRVTYD